MNELPEADYRIFLNLAVSLSFIYKLDACEMRWREAGYRLSVTYIVTSRRFLAGVANVLF